MRGIALVQAAERLGLPRDDASNPDANGGVVRAGQGLTGHRPLRGGSGRTITLRAFGPMAQYVGKRDLTGYEASLDWQTLVIKWNPDLLIGDLRPDLLEPLRRELSVPAWLLMRIWPGYWKGAPGWERVIAIEPGVRLDGITDRVPPIVGPRRVWLDSRGAPDVQDSPAGSVAGARRASDPDISGAPLPASYNSWHEAIWYGYHDRVTWTDGGRLERRQRIAAGSERFAENGADAVVRMAIDALLRTR